MAKRAVEFPKKIYVVREVPNVGESYLVVFEDRVAAIDAVGHGGKVAIYDKLTVRRADITRSFKD